MSKKEEVKDRLKKYIESGNSISYKEIKTMNQLSYMIYIATWETQRVHVMRLESVARR